MSGGPRPLRSVRVEDSLWEAAKGAASENGDTISDIIRQALWQYIEDHTTKGTK
jgi:antitoxin component of RelBE/YafQ-DinJ toxin-antitoxin module